MSQLSFAFVRLYGNIITVSCNGAIDGTVASAFPQPLANAAYDSESSSWKMSGSLCQRDAFCLQVFIFASGPLKGHPAYVPMPTSQFRFLDLPVELRVMVYEYLLFEADPIQLKRLKPGARAGEKKIVGLYWHRNDEKGQDASIVKVNRQIHREAVEILYGTNVFELSDHKTFKTFIQIIGASSHFLRRVCIPNMPFAQARNLMKSLSCTPALQKIELNHALICDNTPSPKASVDEIAQALSRFVRLAKRSRDARGIAGNANDTISVYRSSEDEYAAELIAANGWIAGNGLALPSHCLCGPEDMTRKNLEFGERLRAKLAGF